LKDSKEPIYGRNDQTNETTTKDTSIHLKDKFVQRESKGKGGFGIVYKYFNKETGNDVAIKSWASQGNNIDEEHMLNKTKKISKEHEKEKNFLDYYGKHKLLHNSLKILIMECGECSLADILKTGKIYNSREIIYILSHLVEGFAFLQEHGIAHGDIKPKNIILIKQRHKLF